MSYNLLTLTDAELLALTDADLLALEETGGGSGTPSVPSGYSYYRDITFQPPTATLTNFPVLVRMLNNTGMASRIASSSGYDVTFADAGGTELNFDLDYYDATTGSGAWWVRIPSLPSTTNTVIRMFYGKSSVSVNQSTPSVVWSSYDKVFHFNAATQFPAATDGYSSPNYIRSATIPKVELVPNSMSGIALQFNSGDQDALRYIQLRDTTVSNVPLSISLYGKHVQGSTALAGTQTLFNQTSGSWAACDLRQIAIGTVVLYDNIETGVDVGRSFSTNVFNTHYACASGTLLDTSMVGNMYLYTPKLSLYGLSTTSIAQLDEIRISLCDRSADWLQYEQRQILEHTNYTAYGNEYMADDPPMSTFTFHPWLYIPQRVIS